MADSQTSESAKSVQFGNKDIATGIGFLAQINIKQGELNAAIAAHNQFIEHLRRVYEVPSDWVLTDWLEGFTPGKAQP